MLGAIVQLSEVLDRGHGQWPSLHNQVERIKKTLFKRIIGMKCVVELMYAMPSQPHVIHIIQCLC